MKYIMVHCFVNAEVNNIYCGVEIRQKLINFHKNMPFFTDHGHTFMSHFTEVSEKIRGSKH